nr:hypothetical protein [Tanacetum cinerariifolium]
DGVTRHKKYSELSSAEATQADCDVKATNIILQALPMEIYALVITHKVAKDLWARIQMLMQGTSLTKQERECKLYDAFDKFAFLLLLNEMNMYNMKLEQFQVNTMFLNTLPPEWSKFVTDVKLQQASPYQSSPYTTTYHTPQFVSQGSSSSNLLISYHMNHTSSTVNHNAYIASAPQIDYAPIAHHPSEFSSLKTRLVVPVFQKGDDPIDSINHMMSFLTSVVTSRHNHMSAGSSRPFTSGSGGTSERQRVALIANLSHYGSDNLAEKEESRNIDRELALEKHVKELNNIVFKRSQSAQTTLMLAEESRSKMIEKQNDPQMIDKKVITKPINYAILNQLSTDFEIRFVPLTESSTEQAFWSQYSVQTDEPNLSVQTDEPNLSGTTIVEVLKELPKASMVNSCLKKLKFHLANFDMVVKERTTTTAITEGT